VLRAVETIEAAAARVFERTDVQQFLESSRGAVYAMVAAETGLDISGCQLFRRAVEAVQDKYRQTGKHLVGLKLQH
jgi:hypothetical protein